MRFKYDKLKEELNSLYSSNLADNYNKPHMDKLFPEEDYGCINFGFWNEILSLPITLNERLLSQKKLYEVLFSQFLSRNISTVLEVGCGRGHGVKWLSNNQYLRCFGIDALSEHIARCREKYPEIAENFLQGYAEKLPFKDSFFDVIYSLEAAQHFWSFKKFVQESYRVLNRGGIFCVSTFFYTNRSSISKTKEYIPPNIEGTHRAISLKKALNLLEKNCFKIELVKNIGDHVFPAYAEWQKQMFQNKPDWENISNKQQFNDYYNGGTENGEHPWLSVYKKSLMGYYIIKSIKL